MLRKYIGDRAFYRRVLALTIPIMIQNGITNLVNMLDNVMVGRIGTVEMTGVAIANQLIFVFNLCIFGAVSGAGIFGAQFFGNGDHKGVQYTLRFKLLAALLLTGIGIGVFLLADEPLIQLYLQGEGSAADADASLEFARKYLHIMLVGLLPHSLVQCYSGTLRETGKTTLPMTAGVIAVCTNLALNYILIFGHFGAPKLGVVGAAVATVISRFAELGIVSIVTHANKAKNPFAIGLYHSLYIPRRLARQIIIKGFPLMLNETMWSLGIASLSQCYSVRGLDVVSANNINSTFFNVFSVAFLAVGVSISIILGQQLGANDIQGTKDSCRKLIAFALAVSIAMSLLFFAFAGLIPHLYNVEDNVKSLATAFMRITALSMPLDAFAYACYFALRSGGKTWITILFDSGFMWFVSVSGAFLLVHFTSLPILTVYFIVQGLNILKCIGGYTIVKKGSWMTNIIADAE